MKEIFNYLIYLNNIIENFLKGKFGEVGADIFLVLIFIINFIIISSEDVVGDIFHYIAIFFVLLQLIVVYIMLRKVKKGEKNGK